jgi:hypothetical protein
VLEGNSAERERIDESGPAASGWEGWATQDGKETNFPHMSNEISDGRAAAAFLSVAVTARFSRCPMCGPSIRRPQRSTNHPIDATCASFLRSPGHNL